MIVMQREFYKRNPLLVAPELLGKILVREIGGYSLSGRIVEVEAYLGDEDESSHSFKGLTKRNRSLFKDAGHAYIHRVHNQFCMDIVVGDVDVPYGVLIRALEPIEGIEKMRKNRGREIVEELTSGPGKLTQALGIDLSSDGVDITNRLSGMYVIDDGYTVNDIVRTKRVGISKAKDFEYRFYIGGNPFVSVC
jgi:DNA-3-methyladenine glycosylase